MPSCRRTCWRWAKAGHIQSQWARGAGVELIPVRLLSALGSCPMQLAGRLTAHTRRSVSGTVEPFGICTKISETMQSFLSLTVGQASIIRSFI